MVCESNNCQVTEAIQNLPPELREIIYKNYLAIKLRERAALGWNEVHEALENAPSCEKREIIVNVLFCCKCDTCGKDELCYTCYKNGVYHYLDYPLINFKDYDIIFLKFWLTEVIHFTRF